MSFAIFLTSIIIFFICLGLHIFIWRWRNSRNSAAALLVIFIIFPSIAGVVIAGFNWFGFIADIMKAPLNDWFAVYLLHFAISAGYILSYPAVEAASPSLAISLIIGGSGSKGVLYEDLLHHFNNEILLQPRIKDLMDAKLITESNGYVSITVRGIVFIRPFIFIRRLLGLPIGKG